ncbi:prephenate dehydrogenase [Saccharomonospora sp. NPDC006951]
MGAVRDVCVIGLGLVGGSVLRAASAAGRTAWGATESTVDAKAAASEPEFATATTDIAAALKRASETDALVVLAVPLTAVDEVLRLVAKHAPGCLLTDVTSVKAPVAESVSRIVPGARFVGGHPMAGTAESGWAAGSATLFSGAAWVACVEEDTDLAAWREVAMLALDAGAHVIPLAPAAHDEVVARVSHLPHLLAAVLSSVGAMGGPLAAALAAGSFADGTRVAATRPDLVLAMTEGNRAALLPVLDEALGKLGAARGSLASTGGLSATVEAGYQGKAALAKHAAASRASVRIDLGAPEARDGLIALGERGGCVTALDGDILIGEVA